MARWLFAGHAAREPEALRDLFAVAGARSSASSRFMLTVPGHRPRRSIDVWFRLAFGCQAVWAVREVEPAEPVDFGGTIRPATPDDIEAGIDFDEMPLRAPGGDAELLRVRRRRRASSSGPSAAELWDGTEPFVPFVAERDGRVVALLGLYRRPEGDLRVPENNIDLAFAATLAATCAGPGPGSR